MNDVVGRLKSAAHDGDNMPRMKGELCCTAGLALEAAAEIEDLRKRLADREAEVESLNSRLYNGRH